MRYKTSIYHRLIELFAGKSVAVIGDLLLDRYFLGSSSRLCPEAPVPVVDVSEMTLQLGGAANTACNLSALGASVRLLSVAGGDEAGEQVQMLLRQNNIDTSGVIFAPDRSTLTKSRIVAGNQLIARIDQGTTSEVNERITSALLDCVTECYSQYDAVIISDYAKGVITEQLLQALKTLRDNFDTFLAVDSKRLTSFSILAPDCVKPNYDEARQMLRLPSATADRIKQIGQEATVLREATQAATILVTLDNEGVLIVDKAQRPTHIKAPPVLQPQVSGAGDTFLSGFVLARLAGGDVKTSAEIAIAASSVAVGKECTATCSKRELQRYFNAHVKQVSGLPELRELCEGYRREGKRIVFTNGCFDILHSGHVTYLQRARAQGDVLIVGLNNDASIQRLKGAERPINTLSDRMQVLAGLSSVDHIIAFGDPDDDTPLALVREIRPDIFAKGGDYTRDKLPEATVVEAAGGKVVLLDHVPDHSTTRIINRIRKRKTGGLPVLSRLK